MIEVEIHGPVAKKEYIKILELLESAGQNFSSLENESAVHVTARYGGADFLLVDPGEDYFYYKAKIVTKNPTEAGEAKIKLNNLAKKLKLPCWGQNEMSYFLKNLKERMII